MDNHHRKATRAISVNLIEAVYLPKNYIRKQNKTGKGIAQQCWNKTWHTQLLYLVTYTITSVLYYEVYNSKQTYSNFKNNMKYPYGITSFHNSFPVYSSLLTLMYLCSFRNDRKWSLSITVTGSQVGRISNGSLIWKRMLGAWYTLSRKPQISLMWDVVWFLQRICYIQKFKRTDICMSNAAVHMLTTMA